MKTHEIKGFTLLELLMMVSILSILSISINYLFTSMTFFQTKTTADIIRSALYDTKTLAFANNQMMRIVFSEQTYHIEDQSGNSVLSPMTATASVTLPNHATITSPPTIGFDALGQPYSYATVAQVLTPTLITSTYALSVVSADQNQTVVIQITPQTGVIQ